MGDEAKKLEKVMWPIVLFVAVQGIMGSQWFVSAEHSSNVAAPAMLLAGLIGPVALGLWFQMRRATNISMTSTYRYEISTLLSFIGVAIHFLCWAFSSSYHGHEPWSKYLLYPDRETVLLLLLELLLGWFIVSLIAFCFRIYRRLRKSE